MRRTLLLCFVHGFKGGADTFGARSQFSHDLRKRVAQALPNVDVRVAVYPTYETRGDLAACVARFSEWLLEQVIDIEVAARTPSPTVDPSVHCILIGHSMGGIVAADALLGLAGDKRVGDEEEKLGDELNAMMFPYVQGVLGFDTPYLGIAPGVVAHGAEGQYAAATAALTQITGLTDALWGGSKKSEGDTQPARSARALPSSSSPSSNASKTSKTEAAAVGGAAAAAGAASSSWGWGKIAMYAGAGAIASGAAAAAATAAYKRRDQLTEGWTWATSHLEFVNCLARGEVLRARMARMTEATRQLGVGFGNLYTQLGRAAQEAQRKAASLSNNGEGGRSSPLRGLLPAGERTFCNLPSGQTPAGIWRPAVNDAATDETWAHMSMFDPPQNPNYNTLLRDASALIVQWTEGTAWYAGSHVTTAAAVS
ncbi:uncharacterized protein SPSK_09322 [Sporothrix schenckii 1099-18]|uniref:DUF676 domain-containing protein n=1 Tax=Sporothrix schenckii 1099-18 TaxID=1397361 RepID=A0A0F2M9A1_SPOSC|nr:uncharacterized protein SPSK_09322 [Sporothrix schenckii 1099-18]KJR85659.1 hypothetical protein SPSK_09322 [Sporothrix schenckii 1099-18]